MGQTTRSSFPMIDYAVFPFLTPINHQITSPEAPSYNCVAWAAGNTDFWWQPGTYWPIPVQPGDYGPGVLEQLFLSLGYKDCGNNAALEPGFEKVALYGSGVYYTHVARQL